MSEIAEFHGVCSLCGHVGVFAPVNARSIRDEFPCPQCRAPSRSRDQAALIVDEFGRGKALSLNQLIRLPQVQELRIYEASLHGPFVKHLKNLKGYIQSYYWPDKKFGDVFSGVRNENLCSLTLQNDFYDVVLTSDVFEHIFDYKQAFQEIWRVLKPGGVHIFSIPTNWPFPSNTVACAEIIDDQVQHLTEPRYHVAGDGSPTLVVTDFGESLLDELAEVGFRTAAVRRGTPVFGAHRVLTFVSRKI